MLEESYLAIGAHPDDVVLGVGGYLAHLAILGHKITILTLSSGELAGDPNVREAEERAAARLLGADIEFCRLPDGSLKDKAVVDEVSACIRRVGATTVFGHDPRDRHQDHRQAGRATLAAARNVPTLFLYEGPSTIGFEPTATANVSATWQTKLDALAMHDSQVHARNLFAWVDATARFRAWPRHVGEFCESFRACHVDLARTMNSTTPGLLHADRLLAAEVIA